MNIFPFNKIFGNFIVLMMSIPFSINASAQTSNVPEAVHVICIAQDQAALSITFDSLDLSYEDLSVILDERIRTQTASAQQELRYQAVMRKLVWPLQGLWARSLGTGFVVGTDGKTVMTSYAVASQCPLNAGENQKNRRQIAILSQDGLRPIRASALGINHTNNSVGTPLPKFVCKKEEAPCITKLASALQRDQLEGRGGLAELRDTVKYWVPDLAMLSLEEPITAKPVVLTSESLIQPGATLQYSGFPRSQQQAGTGVSNTMLPSQRATASVQPATFGRIVDYDNSKSDLIVSPERRVAVKWLELSGASIEYGNSGAPLFDAKTGGVVGMVINELDSNQAVSGGKAVPSSQIQAYLKQTGIRFNVTPVADSVVAPNTPATTQSGQVQPVQTMKEWVLSPNVLIVSALLTILVSMVAWLVWRQRQVQDEGSAQPTPTDPKPYTGKATVPNYYISLRGTQGAFAGREYILPTATGKDSLTLGKDPGMCQVIFPETSTEVSGMHCRFVYDTATHSLFLEDKDSTNGTYVNKRRLNKGERVKLKSNDVVGLARPDSNLFLVSIN